MSKMDVMSKSGLNRSKSVGVGTRGDDATTPAGRRQIQEEASRTRRSGLSGRSGTEGAQSVPDLQKSQQAPTKSSLEDRRSRRAKRSGYDHAAAKSSNPDLLEMPDGGMSFSLAKAMQKKACPYHHTDAAAGVLSEQMSERRDMVHRKPKTTKPVYFPEQIMNPVNHADAIRVNHKKDKTLTQGAAGVATDRLTKLQATWITEKDPTKAKSSKLHGATADVIAHTAEEPEPPKRGLRQFRERKDQQDSVTIKHVGGSPETMQPDDVAKWAKMKQVRIRGGEFIYNVAGHEDLLPAATQPYSKADRPPSQSHRRENDKRWLPKFYQNTMNQKAGPTKFEESEDMAFIMGQDTESVLGLDDRESRTSIYSQGGYYRNNMQSTRSGRGYPAPSDDGISIRSDPAPRFSPPTRSQASDSVYDMDRD